MLLDCIGKIGKQISEADRSQLTAAYRDYVAGGLSDAEASTRTLADYGRMLTEAANGLHKRAGVPVLPRPLRSAITPGVDEETRQALVDLAALSIFEGESYEATIAKLKDRTLGRLSDTEIGSIHADAENLTRGEPVEKSPEAIEKQKNRGEHRKRAEAFRGKDLGRIDQKILDLAKDDERLAAAGVFRNSVRSVTSWNDLIGTAYPDLTQNERDELYLRATALRKRAKIEAARDLDNLKSDMSLTDEAFAEYQRKRLFADSAERKRRGELERLYRDLQQSKTESIAAGVLDAVSIPKTLMSGGEVSYVGRQGFLPLVLFTRQGLKGLEGVLAGFRSEEGRLKFEQKMRSHRHFDRAQAAGAVFSQIGDYNVPDEHFAARVFSQMADAKNKLARGIGRTQQKFEHAYTLPGDAQRLLIASQLFDVIDDAGLEPHQKAVAEKAAARIANALTGKSNLQFFKRDNLLVKLINALGFSPSFVGSRFESAFYLSPVGVAFAPKGLRSTMAKKMVRFHGAMATLAIMAALALDAEGEDDERSRWDIIDPSSKSFLKGRIRGTDKKFDLTANMSEPMRLMFYNAVGSAVFAAMGDWNKLSDIWKQERERYLYTDSGEPLRYFRGKLSPFASFVYDVASGKDYLGRDVKSAGDIALAASQRLYPLTYQQAIEALISDQATELMRPSLSGAAEQKIENIKRGDLNFVDAAAMLVFAGLGANLQDFAETERSRAETKAWDMYSGFESKKKSPEEKAIHAGIRRIYRFREEQLRDRRDISVMDKRLGEILAENNIDAEAAKQLEAEATGSRFAFVTKRMSADEVKMLIDEYATEKEMPELEAILESKLNPVSKKPPRPLADRFNDENVADAINLYRDREPEMTPRQRLEATRKIREKAMNSNGRRQMSAETYKAVKSLLSNFPPHIPPVKRKRTVRGMDSLKDAY